MSKHLHRCGVFQANLPALRGTVLRSDRGGAVAVEANGSDEQASQGWADTLAQ